MNAIVYTTSEVASLLRCDERRVRVLVASGKLKAVHTGGARGLRIPVAALEEYLAQGANPLLQKCNDARQPIATRQRLTPPTNRGERKK